MPRHTNDTLLIIQRGGVSSLLPYGHESFAAQIIFEVVPVAGNELQILYFSWRAEGMGTGRGGNWNRCMAIGSRMDFTLVYYTNVKSTL